MKKIFIGSDHAGVKLKKLLIQRFSSEFEFIDLGTHSEESVDYPDFAKEVALNVLSAPGSFGIVICGTGIGVSITANRFKGIRCALCTNSLMAKLSRMHNDANILALGARIIGEELACEIFSVWINTEFQGGRHRRRINKIEEVI